MGFTDDPFRDADRYDRAQQAWLDRRPRCCRCEEPIQENIYYNVHGKIYCCDCQADAWEEIKMEYLEVVEDG